MGTVDPKTKRQRRTPPRRAAGAGGPAPLWEHPRWPIFCMVIINALKPYPEVREAVQEALRKAIEEDPDRRRE